MTFNFGTDPIGSLWGSWRILRNDPETLLRAATKVQAFVDTFGEGYRTTFNPAMTTAGTNLAARTVAISPGPALDRTISDRLAAQVLTGMACHETCHVRCDQQKAAAVAAAFPGDAAAARLSNILGDIHGERHFAEDFPGYADIFAPTLAYVAAGSVKANGGSLILRPADALNFVLGATRYAGQPGITFAQGSARERAYWIDWADRYTVDDDVARHVAGIREALAHIGQQQQPPQGSSGSQDGDSGSQDGDSGSGGSQDDSGSQDGSTADSGAATASDETPDSGQPGPSTPLPSCTTEGTAQTAAGNGAGIGGASAEILVAGRRAAKRDEEIATIGTTSIKVSVAPASTRVVGAKPATVPTSPTAAAAISRVFLASRTGSGSKSTHEPRGRVDNFGLHRIAQQSDKIFLKREYPAPGRYLVWLLVDKSSSMNGQPTTDTVAVAKAFGSAMRHVHSVRMSVKTWTTGAAGNGGNLGIAISDVWSTGQPVDAMDNILRLPAGGTPDAFTLSWAQAAIRKAAQDGETPVIVMLSDGDGDSTRMPGVVRDARRAGVVMLSVAIGDDVSEAGQRAMYGPGQYVSWPGSVDAVAAPLAAMLARVIR